MPETSSLDAIAKDSSPRSALLVGASTGRMTTVLPAIMNEGNDVVSPPEQDKLSSPTKTQGLVVNAASEELRSTTTNVSEGNNKDIGDPPKLDGVKSDAAEAVKVDPLPPTPTPIDSYPNFQLPAYPTLTPQGAGSGGTPYYMGYVTQGTEPASPATQQSTVYTDVGTFFQPQPGAAFHPTSAGQNFVTSGSSVNTPLSPARNIVSVGPLPSSSPLFPRATSGSDVSSTRAPPIPYMSPPLGPSSSGNSYGQYPSGGVNSQSSDEGLAWGGSIDSRNQAGFASVPQGMSMAAYGMQQLGGRTSSGGRTYSFEESMLNPASLEEQPSPGYSPYNSQASPGGTLFQPQQQYVYGPPDPYNAPTSPLQPRPTTHPQLGMYMPGTPLGAGGQLGPGLGMRGPPMGPYGQFYPASSPGPPIQTTASNKGPEGANLFIFHIPNHFTNLDMYNLFNPYGNLLSVRIMVEKESGRSRGFGFVSYDSPESAAFAIKELNGFAIGNKRLKVQHKQIKRQQDANYDRDSPQDGYVTGGANAPGDGTYQQQQQQRFPSALPPSGAGAASQNPWYRSDTEEDVGGPDGAGGAGGIPPPPPPPPPQEVGPPVQQQPPDDGGESLQAASSPPVAAASGGGGGGDETLTIGGAGAPDEQASPLANLGQLQTALPDIPGNGSNSEQ